MATKGAKSNGTKGEPYPKPLPDITRDIFSDFPANDLAVDFGEVHPTALHAIVAGICKLGGYIGFSAPAGGTAIKLRCTVGDSGGERWVRSGHELAAYIIAIRKYMEQEQEARKPVDSNAS